MPSAHKSDIIRALRLRGWIEGAGGEVYFPESRRPHLHASIESGYHDHRDLVNWFRFIVVSRGSEGRSTNLVRDGREVPGGIESLASGEMKTEVTEVCRNLAIP